MFERSVKSEIENAYKELKELLLRKECQVVIEEPPIFISVKHGSLRGISRKGAKKVVVFRLFPEDSGTKIVSTSSLSPDWVNLTLYGSILAALVSVLFWWIATDIESLLTKQELGFWSWLASAFGYPTVQNTLTMIMVMKILAVFLAIAIALEIAVVVHVYPRIDEFAEETLDVLH